jgi:hypothetical protein
VTTRRDPRLDWHPRHDPRSRSYPVRTLIGPRTTPKPRLWNPGPALDQGSEGACVGFAWSGELAASPIRVPNVTDQTALELYRQAQGLDEWEGEDYSGTSVLAGAKAVMSAGYIGEYRWSFSVDDLRDAVSTLGPAVLGIPWLESMYEPRPSGLLEVSGPVAGGHAILCVGYHPGIRLRGEGWLARHEVFVLRNSWGAGYGHGGNAYVRASDLGVLLADQGEACVPLARRYG